MSFLAKARESAHKAETNDPRDRILIIDDLASRYSLKNIINRSGFLGICAASEDEVTLHFKKSVKTKAIVIHTQFGNTLQNIARFRGNPVTNQIPIIISSPHFTKEDIQMYLKQGASQFIVLPLNESKVNKLLEDIKAQKRR